MSQRTPNTIGSFSRSFITDICIDKSSESYKQNDAAIKIYPGQAVYVYSFKEHRMVFAKGWKSLLGFEDEEIHMVKLVDLTTEKYQLFSEEINDRALEFLFSRTENLEEYSFTLELEKYSKNNAAIPLIWRVSVHKSENGKVTEIIGHAERIKSLRLGKIMNYAAYGPEKFVFEEALNKHLFGHLAISKKEKEALTLAADGFSFKEIAEQLNVSHSAIEKRINPLYKRFNCKGLTHLVSFAYNNQILG